MLSSQARYLHTYSATKPAACRPLTAGPLPRRLQLRVHASQGGSTSGSGSDPKKADFSAYWAQRFRNFFSARRKYLSESEREEAKDPEFLIRLQQELDETEGKLQLAEQEVLKRRKVEVAAARQASAAADAVIDDKLRKLLKPVLKDQLRDDQPVFKTLTGEDVVLPDVENAREHMQTSGVRAMQLMAVRTRQLLFEFVLLPITLIKALQQKWTATFETTRYENFLMAEGERIWYWRNRQENERWFWEIFLWDRLLFPIICTVAYEYIVPSNFVWAVIVPMSFIFWQSGEFPSWRNLEFWLIAYFGFYQKCWPDFLALVSLLTQWS